MQRLKHGYLVTLLCHVASNAQSRRARAHHSHFYAVAWSYLWYRSHAALTLKVGRETLKITNGHGFAAHLQVHTTALTLLLLWTHTSAHGRQSRCVFEHLGCGQELSSLNVLDKRRNVYAHGAPLYTGWLGAVETAVGFSYGHLSCQATVHLFCACRGTVGRVELRHRHSLYLCSLLGLHG